MPWAIFCSNLLSIETHSVAKWSFLFFVSYTSLPETNGGTFFTFLVRCGYQLHQILVLIFDDKMEYESSKNENWKIKKRKKWDVIKHTWHRVCVWVSVCASIQMYQIPYRIWHIPMSNVDVLNNVEMCAHAHKHPNNRSTHTYIYFVCTRPHPQC